MRWEIINPNDPFGHTGKYINLLTVDNLHKLQSTNPDVPLTSIMGEIKKARDCDDDDRGGYTAFGFPTI